MKRIFAFITVLVTLFSFCACAENPHPADGPKASKDVTEPFIKDETQDSTTSSETTPAVTTAPVSETEPSVTTAATSESTTSAATTTDAATTTSSAATTSSTTTKADNTTQTAATTTTAESKSPPPEADPDYLSEMSKLINEHPYDCAVLIYSMDGKTLYSYQPDLRIPGASLIKLPYVYYCCTQLSNGVHDMNETITYTEEWYRSGTGIIRLNDYGREYTVSQLIDYTLRYSDNVAYDMLIYLFGMDGFNKMIKDWGYSIRITEDMHFPGVTALFMKTSMQKMQAKSDSGDCWSIAWTALNESTNCYSRKAIGGSDKIAVKYGCIADYWHEVCYVSGKTPYILVIMGGASDYSADVDFVTGVAKCADNIVKEYYGNNDITPPPDADAPTTTTVTTAPDKTASTESTTVTSTTGETTPQETTTVTTTVENTTPAETTTVTTAPEETTPKETTTVTTATDAEETTVPPEEDGYLDPDEIYQILMSFEAIYPEGTSWTNETRKYTSSTIIPYFNYIGYGCVAFAFELSDAAFGDLPRTEHYDITKIRVGDILRINDDSHTVIVLEVNSDGVVIAEGNYNSIVHWGRFLSNEELEGCLTYVWTRYP